MGAIRNPAPVKLFVAMLVSEDGKDKIAAIDGALESQFGEIDLVSEVWDFDCTDYYAKEMGENLSRRIVSFERLIDPSEIVAAKLTTNDLEEQLTGEFRREGAGRIVNLDAGYLSLSQVVLATTKSYTHRIYLRKGIWAEVTLQYHKGRYERWEWTYPDYASGRYNDFFLEMREAL